MQAYDSIPASAQMVLRNIEWGLKHLSCECAKSKRTAVIF